MELTAAVVSTKMNKFLNDESQFADVKEYFWVDSKIVLGYINNKAKRFNVFVANRMQQIRDLSRPESWSYVDSKSNPSDFASRGMNTRLFQNECTWLNGVEAAAHLRLALHLWASDLRRPIANY